MQVRGVAHPVQTAFSEMQKRRLEKIERGLSPESTSAVAGVVGAVVGLGAGWLLKGSLAAKAGGAERVRGRTALGAESRSGSNSVARLVTVG